MVTVLVAHVGLGDVCRLARGLLHRLLYVREQGFSKTSSHWFASGARSARPSWLCFIHCSRAPAAQWISCFHFFANWALTAFIRCLKISMPLSSAAPSKSSLRSSRAFALVWVCPWLLQSFFQRNECVEVGKHPKTNPDFAGQRISTSAENDTLANQHKKKHEQSQPTWSQHQLADQKILTHNLEQSNAVTTAQAPAPNTVPCSNETSSIMLMMWPIVSGANLASASHQPASQRGCS